jgi:hypothetical protein
LWQPDSMIRAVTANLGCASPSRALSQRVAAASRWSDQARAEVDLAFLQEVPDGLIEEWVADGFVPATPQGRRYRPRSALLWRGELASAEGFTLQTAGYHGSYVSSALLRLPGFSDPVVCVSFHASPNPVEQHYRDAWQACDLALPPERQGGGRHSGELFDADMVVATLKLLARTHLVLAAGDLNECEEWDKVHDENWWEPLERTVTSEPGDLEFPVRRLWQGERRSLFKPGAPGYQLDHVLTSPAIGGRIRSDAHVDERWTEEAVLAGSLFDHAPIYFSVDVE